MAGALIRELERKLPEAVREEQSENFTLCRRVLAQKPHDTDKIYSLHEPHVYRVAKGKEHKKYEFETNPSVAITKTHERRTPTTLTLCLKSLTRPRPLPTSGPDAPSWIALTAAENVLHRGPGARKSAQTPSYGVRRF